VREILYDLLSDKLEMSMRQVVGSSMFTVTDEVPTNPDPIQRLEFRIVPDELSNFDSL